MIPLSNNDNPLAPFSKGELTATPPGLPLSREERSESPLTRGEGGLASSPSDDIFTGLKDWQRDVLQARLIILGTIDTYMKETGRSRSKSIEAFLASVSNGGPQNLKRAVDAANNRKGDTRVLSSKTIYKWYQLRKKEGNIGLAPLEKEAGGQSIPLWAPAFLELYRQPSKPKIPRILEEMGPDAPPYHQVIRFLNKFSNLDILRGRMSGSDLRAHRAYTKRDFSGLLPMDIIVADGHSFKAYVSHPATGKRFLPEVETIIDVASRAIVGWSAGLAESAIIVADAIRHAVTVNEAKPMGGQPAIFYADNGAGNRAKMNSHEVTGILARIGCECKFGIAGNPQGRGIIERVNSSLWVPAAKKLIMYNGKDMDALAQRKRLKIVDKALKIKNMSEHMLSWFQFIDFLAAEVEAYNRRPHTSLPKIHPPLHPSQEGNRGPARHMTPIERWQVFAAEGWQPDILNDDLMRDLFRPQIECTTNRGLVKVFTNEYFNSELEHHNGERVFVNYDIHDPNIVWVRDRQQRLICEAKWNGNRRHYFPLAVVEQARQQRKDRRIGLKQRQIREIEEEAMGVIDGETCIPDAYVIENVGAALALPCIDVDGIDEEGAASSAPTQDTGEQPTHPGTPPERGLDPDHIADAGNMIDRPHRFEDEVERYEWHQKHGVESEADRAFCEYFKLTETYAMLYSEGTK